MLKKLRLKIVLAAMGIVVAMLAIIFGLVYHFTKTDLENSSYAMLQTLARDAMRPNMQPEMNKQVQLPYFVMRIDALGGVYASGYTHYDLTDEDFLVELVQEVLEQKTAEGVLESYQLMFKVQTGINEQRLVFLDISSYNDTLESLVQSSLIIGAVCILVMLAVSILFAYWAVKPVDAAWKQQKQFVSDASHELKTPLTVIMSNAELLQSPDCDEEGRKQFTDSIVTMSQHMRSLVEGLLELARADNGQVKKSFEKLDMSKLVSDAVLPFESMMFEAGLQMQTNIQPQIILTGSQQHLRQVVEILLDNACKYSAPGLVRLQLSRQGKACTLMVSNPGEPIPQEDLEQIFERFYRSDQARSRTGSFGLGLSIARSIVQEHQGKIWAVSNRTGNCFCVQLPCK